MKKIAKYNISDRKADSVTSIVFPPSATYTPTPLLHFYLSFLPENGMYFYPFAPLIERGGSVK
ncbi:MAG: hypothetical protein HXN25_01875 [Prevotella aurantiaca]|nr:hypothetical protein [Prevotella aurantiaca]